MALTSPDISILDFDVTFNLINASTPTIEIRCKFQGPHLNNIKTAFTIISPNGLDIIKADIVNNPVFTDVWTVQAYSMPLVQKQIEWGGNGYSITVFAKDSNNQIFSLEKRQAITKPGNLVPDTLYPCMNVEITTRCEAAKMLLKDLTNYTYLGGTGLEISRALKLIYPGNEVSTAPAPFTYNGYWQYLQIPLVVNGDNHHLAAESTREYNLENAKVRFRYAYRNNKINVNCYVDLCKLVQEVRSFEKRIGTDCCGDEQAKLMLVNLKMNEILAAKMQPACGIPIMDIVKEIEEIIGVKLDCNCSVAVTPLDGSSLTQDSLGLLNSMLNGIDPKCIATQADWQGYTLVTKFQMMINKICNPACETPVLNNTQMN